MNDKINGRTPEEIYKALRCVVTQINDDCEDTCDSCKNCPNNFDGGRRELAVHLADAIVRIQQLERERDALKNKPMAWEDVIMSDSFLEVKDEYVGAALLQCAFSHDEYCADDEVTFTTHLNDLKIYYRSEYGKSWRCWPRFPTDEERAAAKWEVNENAQESP